MGQWKINVSFSLPLFSHFFKSLNPCQNVTNQLVRIFFALPRQNSAVDQEKAFFKAVSNKLKFSSVFASFLSNPL